MVVAPRAADRGGALGVARADLLELLSSPLAWVIAVLFVFFGSGYGFIATVVVGAQGTMGGVVAVVANFLVLVLVPVLVAGVTGPAAGTREVGTWAWAVGASLAAFAFYVLLLAMTVVFVAILRVYLTSLDLGLVAAMYAGMLLAGSAASAVSVLAWSLARNRVASFLVALGLLAFIWYAGYAAGLLAPGSWGQAASYASGFERLQGFALGEVALRDATFFCSVVAGALLLSTRVTALGRRS